MKLCNCMKIFDKNFHCLETTLNFRRIFIEERKKKFENQIKQYDTSWL